MGRRVSSRIPVVSTVNSRGTYRHGTDMCAAIHKHEIKCTSFAKVVALHRAAQANYSLEAGGHKLLATISPAEVGLRKQLS